MKIKAKWILFLVGICTLVGIASLTWRSQQRTPAHVGLKYPQIDASKDPYLNSAQVKTEMILALQWTEHSDGAVLRIESKDPAFCDRWKKIEVRLQADGVADSDGAPAAVKTGDCQAGFFEMGWSGQIQEWGPEVQRVGDYFEMPSRFFVQSIRISGPIGVMLISSYEIQSILNCQLILEAR